MLSILLRAGLLHLAISLSLSPGQLIILMEPERVSKSFGCFPHKGLKLSGLPRGLRSKSSSTLSSSPRSPISPAATTSRATSREDELREVFRRFDADNDGKISAMELRAYFGSVGEYMSQEEAEGVIEEHDRDGDNSIDFEDFLKLMSREGGGDHEDLKAAFETFEFEKGAGRITPKSLQKALSRLGDSTSYDQCVTMIQVFDIDGNGEIDYHEFCQMMA